VGGRSVEITSRSLAAQIFLFGAKFTKSCNERARQPIVGLEMRKLNSGLA
jgi:hypothetical protein